MKGLDISCDRGEWVEDRVLDTSRSSSSGSFSSTYKSTDSLLLKFDDSRTRASGSMLFLEMGSLKSNWYSR